MKLSETALAKETLITSLFHVKALKLLSLSKVPLLLAQYCLEDSEFHSCCIAAPPPLMYSAIYMYVCCAMLVKLHAITWLATSCFLPAHCMPYMFSVSVAKQSPLRSLWSPLTPPHSPSLPPPLSPISLSISSVCHVLLCIHKVLNTYTIQQYVHIILHIWSFTVCMCMHIMLCVCVNIVVVVLAIRVNVCVCSLLDSEWHVLQTWKQ